MERLEAPRLLLVEKDDWTPAQRAYLEPYERAGRLFNVFKTALLRAGDAFISNPSWKAFSRQFDTRQLMDLIFTVDTYQVAAMALDSWGVQLDDGLTGFRMMIHPALCR